MNDGILEPTKAGAHSKAKPSYTIKLHQIWVPKDKRRRANAVRIDNLLLNGKQTFDAVAVISLLDGRRHVSDLSKFRKRYQFAADLEHEYTRAKAGTNGRSSSHQLQLPQP